MPQLNANRPNGPEDHLDLDRGERFSTVLRADLRGQLIHGASPVVAKTILFVLDSFPPDRCFPSEELIARSACTSIRTLQKALAALIEGGIVETRTRNEKGTRYRSPRFYIIRYDRLAGLDSRVRRQSTCADTAPPSNEAACADTAPPSRSARADTAHADAPACADTALQPAPIRRPTTSNLTTEYLRQTTRASGKRSVATLESEIELANLVAEFTPALVKLGVSRKRVADLIVEAGSRERLLEVIELLRARLRRGRVRNPGGWIAQAIREGWRSDGTAEASAGSPRTLEPAR